MFGLQLFMLNKHTKQNLKKIAMQNEYFLYTHVSLREHAGLYFDNTTQISK